MPGSTEVYINTSVLIKRFVEEAFSTQVDVFFEQNECLVISDLVILEFDCALRRMQRNSRITEDYRLKAEQALMEQIADQWFEKLAIPSQIFKEAKRLIDQISPLALRSLDAMHLSLVQSADIKQIATADIEMRQVAEKLGLTTHYFNH